MLAFKTFKNVIPIEERSMSRQIAIGNSFVLKIFQWLIIFVKEIVDIVQEIVLWGWHPYGK